MLLTGLSGLVAHFRHPSIHRVFPTLDLDLGSDRQCVGRLDAVQHTRAHT